MNYLAHLYLAGPSDASRIGNLLGDFVKGTPASLADDYPDEVIAGIMMHRRLDRFTDAHEQFLRARDMLAPERRRFAGIVIDIFFDHFLSRYWSHYSEQPLPEFIDDVYCSLERHPGWLSPDLAAIRPRMREENWLQGYGSLEGVAHTLSRLVARSPRTAAIEHSTDDLEAHYGAFRDSFVTFLPDARAYAATLLSQVSHDG